MTSSRRMHVSLHGDQLAEQRWEGRMVFWTALWVIWCISGGHDARMADLGIDDVVMKEEEQETLCKDYSPTTFLHQLTRRYAAETRAALDVRGEWGTSDGSCDRAEVLG